MKKIMIVEDDMPVARALRDYLSRDGYEVVISEDADSALASIDKTFSLILLDILLTGSMDGFGILTHLKKDSELHFIPVVILTNIEESENIEKARELGASDYIIKSNNNLGDISNAIKKLIGEV